MDRTWLEKDTALAAEQLIGCHLVRRMEQGLIRVRITETEAYKGGGDPASHAYRGMTPRNRLMFGEVGHLYVYFIYGMHFCMNVVAHEKGAVGAVLLRAAEPVEGTALIRANRPGIPDRLLLNGPGKLAKALAVGADLNGLDLLGDAAGPMLLLPRQEALPVKRTARIGISAGKELLWRFIANDRGHGQ